MTHDVPVTISRVGALNQTAALSYTVANTVDGYIKVLNNTGYVLPETGGTGTVIFVTVGSILVLGMGLLLVVKKRMTKVEFVK